jgi:hypothetical protein
MFHEAGNLGQPAALEKGHMQRMDVVGRISRSEVADRLLRQISKADHRQMPHQSLRN